MTQDPFAACLALPETDGRHLVAIAGPPASGKSTLAAELADSLSAAGRAASVLPMDGFHLGNAVLDHRGLRPRKGSPETFDLNGFTNTLHRITTTPRIDIAIPLFDRTRDLAEAGAAIIPDTVEIVVVEGNYLLLDRPGWTDLAKLWTISVFLSVPIEVLEQRLMERWADLPPDEARRKVEENDLPNARLVADASVPADICLSI